MDIFNRPPAISEDSLHYSIYCAPGSAEKASATTLAAVIQTHVQSLLPGHIWHRDPFELKIVTDPDDEGSWMLEGKMRVGDCVDDEWCVVWLLKEISAKWDVAISVYDSDGEFLLIEAAEALPSWVSPTNAENRVWIYASHLHLIPLSHVSAPSSKRDRRRYPGGGDSDNEGDADHLEDYLTAKDALKLLREPSVDTQAPGSVERTVWQRVNGYPEAAHQHVHTTLAYIPHDIAQVLAVDPSLVQKPIETFYTRDTLQLRAAHKMTRFPPVPSILRPVKMTRTAYAQLMGQKFHPPKVFGRWREKHGTKEWRHRDTGMKIACGFEMLFQESKNRSEGVSTSETLQSLSTARKEALHRNPDYVKYIQTLQTTSYFKGEVEGSALWNEQEDKAAAMFVEARREDDATRPSFATLVNSAIARSPEAPIATFREDEDSDDWLNVDAADFDAMLEKTMGTSKTKEGAKPDDTDAMAVDGAADKDRNNAKSALEDNMADVQASRLQDLAKKVEQFVEGKGDVEGAKFADEDSDSGAEMSDFSDEHFSDSDDEGSDPNLDQIAHDVKRRAAMDLLVPPLGADEYGKMPASFHSNSQRVTRDPVIIDEENASSPALPSSNREEEERKGPPVTMRPPILPRDKYEGVDSDDETDSDADDPANAGFGDLSGDESDEDRPQVVGEVEVDMGEEEEEFLEFSRQALGISDAQWDDILSDRKARGAFIPTIATAKSKPEGVTKPSGTSTSTSGSTESAAPREPRQPMPGPRPNVNPSLDSFETVMQAMEDELARQKIARRGDAAKKPNSKAATPDPSAPTASKVAPAGKDKGKAKAQVSFAEEVDEEDDNMDIEAAMDAELKAALDSGAFGDDADTDREISEAGVDYNLIKNFLESFKSQAGLSGPVGNLAGRLQPGWTLPRDES